MPEISRFLGIIITMYYNDHPPPHFHVRYGGQKALVAIEALTILPRVLGLVIEWAASHQTELMENWEIAQREEPLNRIAPLE
jgi:hypothetical protein